MLNLFFMLGLPEIFLGPLNFCAIAKISKSTETKYIFAPSSFFSSSHIQKMLFLFSDLFFSKKKIVVEFFLLPKMSFPIPQFSRPTQVHSKLFFVFYCEFFFFRILILHHRPVSHFFYIYCRSLAFIPLATPFFHLFPFFLFSSDENG